MNIYLQRELVSVAESLHKQVHALCRWTMSGLVHPWSLVAFAFGGFFSQLPDLVFDLLFGERGGGALALMVHEGFSLSQEEIVLMKRWRRGGRQELLFQVFGGTWAGLLGWDRWRSSRGRRRHVPSVSWGRISSILLGDARRRG